MAKQGEVISGFFENQTGEAALYWRLMFLEGEETGNTPGSVQWQQYIKSTWELTKLYHAMLLTFSCVVQTVLRNNRRSRKCSAEFGICVPESGSSVEPLSDEQVRLIFSRAIHPSGKTLNPEGILAQMKFR